jgi:hypothetical protein
MVEGMSTMDLAAAQGALAMATRLYGLTLERRHVCHA